MIRVTRIAGESFDFETRQETPKALVLSNGQREYAVYVDDDTARIVLEMMLETPATSAPKNGSAPNHRPSPAQPVIPKVRETSQPVEHLLSSRPQDPPPMATVGDGDAEEELNENIGFEPGEEYNDPATGAESL